MLRWMKGVVATFINVVPSVIAVFVESNTLTAIDVGKIHIPKVFEVKMAHAWKELSEAEFDKRMKRKNKYIKFSRVCQTHHCPKPCLSMNNCS